MKKLTNWQKIIKEISATGMTQAQIGEKIGLTQPTVNQLSTGFTLKMYYEEGAALMELHKKIRRQLKLVRAKKAT